MMNKQLLIFYYFIHSILSLEKFLQFIPHEEVTDRKSVYELNQLPISVDAFQNNQILIKYIQYIGDLNFPNIKFYCHVKTLNSNYKINNAQLCKKESILAKEDCHVISKDTQQIKFGEVMEFEAKYDATIGITAILNMEINLVKSRMKPFDGFYYCKLNNPLGFISSNYIEIQDYEFYKKKLSNLITPITKKFEPTPINNITSNSFPIYLHCGNPTGNYEHNLPKWANKDLLSSFSWALCPNGKSGIECYTIVIDTQSKKSRTLEDFMDYYQFPNGTVVLMGIKGNDYTKSGLVCSSKSIPPKAYAIYLIRSGSTWAPINYIQSNNYEKKIQKLSPTNVNVVIREGTYRSSRFRLYASYIVNPDHTKVIAEWKNNGYSLPPTFEQGSYQLTFPPEITESHAGTYVLKVSQSEPLDSTTFTYSVTVVSAPKLKGNLKYPPIIYRTVDQFVHINVSFERNITEKSLEINGIQIDFSTEKNKENSINNLCFKFPLLTGINITANFSKSQDPGMIIYEAKNLYRSQNSLQVKTHTVTLIAENEIGVSKVSYLIRVFENPIFKNYLNAFNCTNNCRNDQNHVFKCSINETEYLAEGCTVQYLWALNGLSLNNMNEGYDHKAYFEINNDTIILKTIKSNDLTRDKRMIDILANSNLSCQIVIYEPAKPGYPSLKLYSSENYPYLKSLLEAKINLQVNPIDTASTPWILPFVISLIVIVIIVVLILYFCLRGSGETYNVDQKERAQGHDPEKEMRENEVFQPYERDHETHVIQPSHLSFNDDDSVGVGSDDGELDVYDIDPGKFNEEGSFIGQYASDPRRNKINNS